MLHEHLDQVLDLFNDAVCVTDAQATVLYLNTTYEKLLGFPRSILLGKDVREFQKNGTFDTILNPEVIATGQHITRVQTTRNGNRLLLDSYPIFNAEHKAVYCVTFIRDNNRLRDLQNRLQSQQELLDVFFKLSNSSATADALPEIIESQAMRILYAQTGSIARTDAPVLLLGETGSGKDVLARRIHRESGREARPFIKVDCGSIAPGLIETELFGYVGGTFSGANRHGKIGLIEAAARGTVFLDEIGELPLAMQTRLLRFLQDGEILRVGATTPIRPDVRIISATNKDLEKAVAEGEFRRDLYYRLKIAVLHIPALRERPDDILPMSHLFLDFYARKYGRRMAFSPEADDLCLRYEWPGNVRELKNMVQGLAVTCQDSLIQPKHLPFAAKMQPRQEDRRGSFPEIAFDGRSYKDIMKDMETALLRAAMQRFGSIAGVARELRLDRSTVFRKIKELEKNGVKI